MAKGNFDWDSKFIIIKIDGKLYQVLEDQLGIKQHYFLMNVNTHLEQPLSSCLGTPIKLEIEFNNKAAHYKRCYATCRGNELKSLQGFLKK